MRKLLTLLLLLGCCTQSFGQVLAPSAPRWVEGFYAGWQKTVYPPSRVDYTALTHIALAFWTTNTNGTLADPYTWNTSCSAVVTPAHANSVKVIASIGGASDTNFATAVATNMATLLSSIATVVSNCNLDGVDINWEQSINVSNYISLVQNLRSAHPTWVITVPIDASVNPVSLAVGLAPYVDQDNIQTYGNGTTGAGCYTWYFAPLDGDITGGSPVTCQPSVMKDVNAWIAAGVPPRKIGIGAGFYANAWTTPVTGPLQSNAGSTINLEIPYGWSIANGGGLLSCYYNQSGWTYLYDPSPAKNTNATNPAQQPAINNPTGSAGPSGCGATVYKWVTFEDEASIAAKAAFVKQRGLGGIIIWTIGEGNSDTTTGRNPLLDATKRYFNNSGPASMPLLGTTGQVTVGTGTTTIGPITGLPSNLGIVNVRWWNFASGAAWDDTADSFGTFGQPLAYTIQASPNGSTWTTLTTVTASTNCTPSIPCYAGRQFAYDFTGTGYTQVRMVVTSIVGTNAGGDVLDIFGQTNNYAVNDTWLFFGDSITSNCLTAANDGTGPIEQIGAQINIRQPSRYPAVTVGGQSGWLTSTALSTTPYGVPAIQKYLADHPSFKFVTLNLGTNDANGSVSAATYSANMQQLVQYVIAAGKTPVIPTLIPSPALTLSTVQAYNSALATLEKNFPSIIPGPDLYSVFLGHSTSDGYFFDTLHPSLGLGCNLWQASWVQTMLNTVYPTKTTTVRKFGKTGVTTAIGQLVGAPPAPSAAMFAMLGRYAASEKVQVGHRP